MSFSCVQMIRPLNLSPLLSPSGGHIFEIDSETDSDVYPCLPLYKDMTQPRLENTCFLPGAGFVLINLQQLHILMNPAPPRRKRNHGCLRARQVFKRISTGTTELPVRAYVVALNSYRYNCNLPMRRACAGKINSG